MTPCILEEFLFSKLHFDPQGFIVATRDGQPVAFVHAGFGPADDSQKLDTTLGVTHRVMMDPEFDEAGLGTELLARSEEYLVARGGKVLYGGGVHPLDAFYHGLYGGSELPGILDSDPDMQQLFIGAGYRAIDRVIVLQCDLSQVRSPITRASRQWNRCCQINLSADVNSVSWWRRRTTGCIDAQRFELHHAADGLLASTTLWDLEPLASYWGVRAVGVLDLSVAEPMRRRGVATHLLCEVMRQLRLQGVGVIEAQTMSHNEPALATYRKLGFVETDCGAVYRKETP